MPVGWTGTSWEVRAWPARSASRCRRPEDDVADRRLAPHDRELLLTYYREMLLIRRFEEKAGQLYGMGLIGGFCHLYIGQEAVAVGVQHALQEGDR